MKERVCIGNTNVTQKVTMAGFQEFKYWGLGTLHSDAE